MWGVWRRRHDLYRVAQFNDTGHEREHLCLSYLHFRHDLIICSNVDDCSNIVRSSAYERFHAVVNVCGWSVAKLIHNVGRHLRDFTIDEPQSPRDDDAHNEYCCDGR